MKVSPQTENAKKRDTPNIHTWPVGLRSVSTVDFLRIPTSQTRCSRWGWDSQHVSLPKFDNRQPIIPISLGFSTAFCGGNPPKFNGQPVDGEEKSWMYQWDRLPVNYSTKLSEASTVRNSMTIVNLYGTPLDKKALLFARICLER